MAHRRGVEVGIPERFLRTTVPSARAQPPRELTTDMVGSWYRNNETMFLLRIPSSGARLPMAVRRYLDSDAGRHTRQGCKCRHRTPWYAVPDGRVPGFFLSCMAGRTPKLVKNAADASCANALHGVEEAVATLRSWRRFGEYAHWRMSRL